MRKGYFCCFFDIVNGFLIDAVVHWFAACGAARFCMVWIDVSLTDEHLAEIIVRTLKHFSREMRPAMGLTAQILCRSVVDGVDSQA
jgi:hypothetical protein